MRGAKLKIFSGQDRQKLENEVNEFMLSHVCPKTNECMGFNGSEVFYTIFVWHL